MAKELQIRGCDVQVITGFPNYPTGRVYEGYGGVRKDEVVDGIKVRRHWLYPSNSKNPVLRILSMTSFSLSIFLSVFFLRKRNAEVTIINSPPLFTGYFGVILARIIGGKIVTNISDIWPLSALELGAIKKGILYSLFESMEKSIYRRADLCVSQSEETASHIKEIVPERRVVLYRNLSKVQGEHGAAIDNSPAKPFKIVYAGLLGVAQGIYRIIQNVDFVKLNVELHIYGEGNEASKIIEYLKLKPESNIVYHGLKSPKELGLIFPTFHASLIPLVNPIYGAFPSKIFGAMSSGVPILFSGEGEGAKFVSDYEIGFVNSSTDLKQLESNIEKLRNLPTAAYIAIRERSRELMLSEFSFEKNQDNLHKSITDLVSGELNHIE